MIFPYSTDAPVYHFPFATIGLIVLNTVIFFASVSGVDDVDLETPPLVEHFILHFDTIAPWQWLTNNFLHADLFHLLGNMVFLWAFGLIVEGKIGWWRFLALYLFVGVVYGAVIQIGMLMFSDGEGAALGASAAIFALIGMAAIWAPKNDLHCATWFWMPRVYEIPILTFGLGYLAFQLVFLTLKGFSMSSEMLHVVGLCVGVPLGVLALKGGWVDCEGWDLFNVLAGTEGEKNPAEERQFAEGKAAKEEALRMRRNAVLEAMQASIASGNPQVALKLLEKQQERFVGEDALSNEVLLSLIQGLHRQKKWEASVPLMTQVLQQSTGPETTIRLQLAQILIQVLHKPGKALRILRELPQDLPDRQAAQCRRLTTLAEAARASEDAELELEDD